MESGTWLRYWRNSLADADRQRIDITKQASLTAPLLDAEALQAFYTAHYAAAPEAAAVSELETLAVMLAPFSLRPVVGDSRRTAQPGQARAIHPFWIPARLTKTGQLQPPTSNEHLIPWLIRDVLEPTTRNAPVLGSLTTVDSELALWTWKTDTWKQYYTNAQAFYAKATASAGWPANRAEIGDWVVDSNATLTLMPPQGMAANIIGLYRYLEKQSRLPALLTTLLQGQAAGLPLNPEALGLLSIKGHYGQMGNSYPLSTSQRSTLQALLKTASGDVFPVNGPPGTGKTTLLQSIVANLIVEKAVLGQEAPRILASSTNNQAITNILDSFGREARVSRWVPEAPSLGVFLTNSNVAENEQRGYQVQTTREGFCKAKEAADGRYLRAAETELLRQGAAFFGIEYPTPAALRIKLHHALLQQVTCIDAWLDLLPRLYDERGEPWNAEQLRQALQTGRATIAALEAYQLELLRLQASESSFENFLAAFLASVRKKKQARYQFLVRTQCPYSNEVTDFDPEQLKLEVAQRLEKAQQALLHPQAALGALSTFDTLAAQLRRDYAAQKEAASYLQALSAADASSIHNVLDVTHRHSAFVLALHYWEARYVVALQEKLRPAQPPRRGYETKPEQFARWAMLTPCFISTFHTVANFLVKKSKDGESSYALELFDLLLVDESGQVSPEVGAAAFALAKKAVVVGDTNQIEPVWNLLPALDAQNQRRVGIVPAECPLAYQVSAGSLMRLAQLATPFRLTNYPQERGLLLRQHRRSKPEIIRYCDEYVYGGQLERLANPSSLVALGLPPLGYIHIAGECTTAGGSRQNQQEAEAIASWLRLMRDDILAAARSTANPTPRLQDLVGIVTPFSGQKLAIQRALRAQGLGNENLTVGTVHALQGAERTIVLFSPVYDASHRGGYFFDQGYNLLNVAVSRAKEAFLVIGNRCLFNPARNTPSGNLAKLLFDEPAEGRPRPELDNSFFYGDESRRHLPVPREHLTAVATGKVDRLSELEQHRRALAWAINTAQEHLVIVSPFISANAIQADGLTDLIVAAKVRQPTLRITVYTDAHLDAPRGQLHPHAQAGRAALRRAGAEVKIAEQIHNKTICLDNHALLEGSFNWLGAARSGHYVRHEVSWFFRGTGWAGRIEQLVQEMEERVVNESVISI
jgi:hypothetical protein